MSGYVIGEAKVRLRPEASPTFEAEAKQQVEAPLTSMAGRLRETLGGIGFGLAAKEIVMSSANLQAAVGGNETVFKEQSASMEDWAEGADQMVGLSEQLALSLSTRLGGALQGYGFGVEEAATKSRDLVQMGADLSATFGGTTEEAVQGISAALRGEYDSIERWIQGLNETSIANKAMEMGLAKTKEGLTGEAKARAALALIEEKAAIAKGQFGRESDQVANQLQRAKAAAENAGAAVGTVLLPAISSALQIITPLVKGFGGLSDTLGTFGGGIQVAVIALGGLAAMGKLTPMAEALGAGLTKAGVSAEFTATKAERAAVAAAQQAEVSKNLSNVMTNLADAQAAAAVKSAQAEATRTNALSVGQKKVTAESLLASQGLDASGKSAERVGTSYGAAGTKVETFGSKLGRTAGAAVGVAGGLFIAAEALSAMMMKIAHAETDFGSGNTERYLTSLRISSSEGLNGKLSEDLDGIRSAIVAINTETGGKGPLEDTFLPGWLTGEDAVDDEAVTKVQEVDDALKTMFAEDPGQAGAAYGQLLDELGLSADEGAVLFDDYAGAVANADDAQQGAAQSGQDAAAAQKWGNDQIAAAKKHEEAYAKALQERADKTKEATDRTDELYQATNDLVSLTQSEEEAALKTAQAKRDIETAGLDVDAARRARDETFNDPESTAEDRRRAELDVADAVDAQTQSKLDLVSAVEDEATAAVRTAEAQATLAGETLTAAEKTQIQIDKLTVLAETLNGPARQAILDHIALLLTIPTDITVTIAAKYGTDPGKLQALIAGGVARGLTEEQARAEAENILGLDGRAAGGPVQKGQRYRVNEVGIETFTDRNGDTSAIFPADGTVNPVGQFGAGGGITIHGGITINDARDARKTARDISRELDAQAFLMGA